MLKRLRLHGVLPQREVLDLLLLPRASCEIHDITPRQSEGEAERSGKRGEDPARDGFTTNSLGL